MGFSLKNIFKDDDDMENLNGTEDGYYNISEEDAIKEADKTGNKMILLVNLKRVTSDQAKRIIDFLSGVIYAIGGSMQKIGVGIYLVAPKNVNVQGKITDDSEKTSKNNDEELDW